MVIVPFAKCKRVPEGGKLIMRIQQKTLQAGYCGAAGDTNHTNFYRFLWLDSYTQRFERKT